MLVQWYGTSYACRLIIFNYHLVTPVCLFTLLFVQFIRPNAIADDQKAWPVRSYDVTRRPVSSRGCRTGKSVKTCVVNILSSYLPGHASNCLPAVNHRMTGDSCGLLRWSDCEWSIRFVARDQKGWRDAFIPPHVIKGKRIYSVLANHGYLVLYTMYTELVEYHYRMVITRC